MEQNIEYQKVLFLLLLGWVNLAKIQKTLGYSEDQMKLAVTKLEQQGYVVTRTIH